MEYSAFTSDGRTHRGRRPGAPIPTIFGNKDIVAAGLLSSGTDIAARMTSTAELVDIVLKSAKPADLPVEQYAKLDLSSYARLSTEEIEPRRQSDPSSVP